MSILGLSLASSLKCNDKTWTCSWTPFPSNIRSLNKKDLFQTWKANSFSNDNNDSTRLFHIFTNGAYLVDIEGDYNSQGMFLGQFKTFKMLYAWYFFRVWRDCHRWKKNSENLLENEKSTKKTMENKC